MLDVCFDRAQGGFQPCLRFASTVHKVCLTVLELFFDRTRDKFQPCLRYVSTVTRSMCSAVLELGFRQCARYVSTELEVCFKWLEVCFDYARGIFRPSLKRCFYRRRDLLRLCLMCVSTMLNVGFNRAWGLLRLCTRYLSAVARVIFGPSRKIYFNHARVMF